MKRNLYRGEIVIEIEHLTSIKV